MEMPSSDLRDIVSCPICYEDFDEPKSLPCLHTFCKECLQQLITKTMEPDVKKYFFCPSCRMKVYGPKGVPLEQWADTYPSNHMIRTLQDNIKMEDSDSICSVHKGKELEFFCTDHERTICSMCAVIEHRQCKDVNTVDSAAAKTKEKNFELDGKLHMLNKWMDKRKSQRQQIQTQLRDVETSVRAWRKKINDELDQWEYNLTEHVQTIAATEISQLEQDIRQGEQIMHNLKNVQTDIFGSDLSSRGILESRSSIATVLHAATDVVKSAGSGNTHLLFRFHPDESIKQSLSRIGDIEVVRQGKDTSLNRQSNFTEKAVVSGTQSLRSGRRERVNTVDTADVSRSLKHSTLNPNAKQFLPSGKFDVRTTRDKDDCLITGSTFLPDGNLAITDQSNGKIKIFDKRFNLLSEMGFSSDPWDVCSAGDDIIAVSFPDENLVQFFRVQNGKINSSEGNVKTPGRCYGIDIRGQRLAFTCRSRHGSSVHVVDRADGQTLGTWIKKKNPASTGGMWYLTFDDGGDILYVTDDDENRLVTLAVDGSHGSSLKLLSTQECDCDCPRGVAKFGPNLVLTSPQYTFDLRIYPQPGTRSNIIKASGEVVSIDSNTNRMFISLPSKGPNANINMGHVRPFSC